jgi:hypothetical protein
VKSQTPYYHIHTEQKPVLKGLLGVCVLVLLMLTMIAAKKMLAMGMNEPLRAIAGQQITAEEEKVEAAFIWQFLQFIEFPAPANPQETFVIGIVGTTRVESFLNDILRQKQLGDGRALEVRKISNLDEMVRCNAVFVAPTETPRLSQILGKVRGKPILAIGRDDEFLERGGLVNFYIENSRVRFEYNADDLPNSKLRFSSKLMRLGRQFTKK